MIEDKNETTGQKEITQVQGKLTADSNSQDSLSALVTKTHMLALSSISKSNSSVISIAKKLHAYPKLINTTNKKPS